LVWDTRGLKGGKVMTSTNSWLSAAQRRTLEALAVEGALIMPHTSAIWPVKVGPQVVMMVRWATVDALVRAGYIAHADWPGAYRITDTGRVALTQGTKDSEMACAV
jgi:hypothetical protein